MNAILDSDVWLWLQRLPAPFIIDLIDTYFESSLTTLLDLRKAVAAGDRPQFMFLVHRLKGSSAALGVQTLTHVCAEIEAQHRGNAIDDVAACLHWIEAVYRQGTGAVAVQRAALMESGLLANMR